MNLKIITAPVSEPVTLEEAKSHLKVTSGDEDTLIENLITTARQYSENFTRRALASAVFELVLDNFPSGSNEAIVLPRPPLEEVASIRYKDSDGNETVWGSENYIVYSSEPAEIYPAYGVYYPNFTPYPKGAVKVRYTAGYRTSGDDPNLIIPKAIKQAMLLIIGDWYENREALLSKGHIPKTIPFGVEALLTPYRIFGW